MSQDYTKTELHYTNFLEKINDWYLKENTSILYHYLQELVNEFPRDLIEEFVIRAIADGYLKPRILCQCPLCNEILIDGKKRPLKSKIYNCKGCDEDIEGSNLEITLELIFLKDLLEKKFFRNREDRRILETKNYSV